MGTRLSYLSLVLEKVPPVAVLTGTITTTLTLTLTITIKALGKFSKRLYELIMHYAF